MTHSLPQPPAGFKIHNSIIATYAFASDRQDIIQECLTDFLVR